jgi:hypothetical protein
MAFKITDISIEHLLQLRIQVNEAIKAIEEKALIDLTAGLTVDNFRMDDGRTIRVIKDDKAFRKILRETFEKQYNKLCIIKSEIGLTNVELLIKEQFDADDARIINNKIKKTLTNKTSASKLVYTGDISQPEVTIIIS